MNAGTLSHRRPADLTLTYDTPPGLGRTAERRDVEVVVSRHAACAPVSVLVDRQLGVALLLAPGVSRATLVLPDDTVLAGYSVGSGLLQGSAQRLSLSRPAPGIRQSTRSLMGS